MSSQNLSITQTGAVARITLTQPEIRNAFSDEVIAEITAAFVDVGSRTDVRAAPLGRTADFRQERHGRGVLLRLYAPLRLLPER